MVTPWGTATLSKTTEDDSDSFSFPIVKSITSDINVNLSEFATIIYGYENNFCMDMGTSQKFTLQVERVNPPDYDDSLRDKSRWSNGKWYRELESMLDFWQNFGGYTGDDKTRSGGFVFRFVPIDTTLYPTVTKNVFVNGSIALKYSMQKITFSLPLQVATTNGESANADMITLTLHPNGLDGAQTTTVQYPRNTSMLAPEAPSSWNQYMESVMLDGWSDSPSATTASYLAGNRYTWTDDMDLYAIWRAPIMFEWWDSTESKSFDMPSGASRAQFICVGGGGGAGGGEGRETSTVWDQGEICPGGAGGSGYVTTYTANVSPGDVIRFEVGAGGVGGGRRNNGREGGTTRVYRNESPITGATARGGAGGAASARSGNSIRDPLVAGTGGSYDNAGGMSSTDGSPGTDGADGDGGIGGKGVAGATYDDWMYFGGGGGAAADLNRTIRFGGEDHTFQSKGGDGFTRLTYAEAATEEHTGRWGGGGGGGYAYISDLYAYYGAPGSNGLIVMVVFRCLMSQVT